MRDGDEPDCFAAASFQGQMCFQCRGTGAGLTGLRRAETRRAIEKKERNLDNKKKRCILGRNTIKSPKGLKYTRYIIYQYIFYQYTLSIKIESDNNSALELKGSQLSE